MSPFLVTVISMTDPVYKPGLEFGEKYRQGIAQNVMNLKLEHSTVPRVRDFSLSLNFLTGQLSLLTS